MVIKMLKKKYNEVYDFTNENVACLKDLYHFDNSKVLTVVGSGDQYFASALNGAKKIDLFDINPTSYLYFMLKFYSIRELTYEEFYNFLIKKNFNNIRVYKKLEPVLSIEVLKYYKYLIKFNKILEPFRFDSVNLLSRKNKKYYFDKNNQIIPYLIKENYYILQEKLKQIELPKFYQCDIRDLKNNINDKYDIMLMSNIYNNLFIGIKEYTKLLNELGSPEIEACYDWNGYFLNGFISEDYSIDKVLPSDQKYHKLKENYIYSLKKYK